MAEYIECRECTSPSCKGCNTYTLSLMLHHGKFDCLMNGNRTIHFADVAPVVRCKDCKWFAECVGKDSGKPCGYGQCTRPLCMRSLIGTDDFCSYGERKDGDGNG